MKRQTMVPLRIRAVHRYSRLATAPEASCLHAQAACVPGMNPPSAIRSQTVSRKSRVLTFAGLWMLCLVTAVEPAWLFADGTSTVEPAEELAQRILKETGVKGGLVVHLGCGDGRL